MLKSEITKGKTVTLEDIIREYNLSKYFEIQKLDGKTIFIPKENIPELPSLEEIRAEIEKLGITEEDIQEAIEWARSI